MHGRTLGDILKSKDASGHDHGSDSKFVSNGRSSFPAGAWKDSAYAKSGKVALVPIAHLLRARGNDLRDDTKEIQAAIADRGLDEPVMLSFSPKNDRMKLGEGNHRVAALAAMGATHVPTRAMRDFVGDDEGVPHVSSGLANENGYIPGDMNPADLGIPNAVRVPKADEAPKPKEKMMTLADILKSKDSSGHDHGSDGKFTSGSGGGEKKCGATHPDGKTICTRAKGHGSDPNATGSAKGDVHAGLEQIGGVKGTQYGGHHTAARFKRWDAKGPVSLGEMDEDKYTRKDGVKPSEKQKLAIVNGKARMGPKPGTAAYEKFARGMRKECKIKPVPGGNAHGCYEHTSVTTADAKRCPKAAQFDAQEDTDRKSGLLKTEKATMLAEILKSADASGHEHGPDGKFTARGQALQKHGDGSMTMHSVKAEYTFKHSKNASTVHRGDAQVGHVSVTPDRGMTIYEGTYTSGKKPKVVSKAWMRSDTSASRDHHAKSVALAHFRDTLKSFKNKKEKMTLADIFKAKDASGHAKTLRDILKSDIVSGASQDTMRQFPGSLEEVLRRIRGPVCAHSGCENPPSEEESLNGTAPSYSGTPPHYVDVIATFPGYAYARCINEDKVWKVPYMIDSDSVTCGSPEEYVVTVQPKSDASGRGDGVDADTV